MKINIDTSSQKEKAQAKKVKQTPQPKKPAPKAAPRPAPKPNLAKSPPKEPKAPDDVAAARSRQTTVMQHRQKKELAGENEAFREQAGVGFWPTVSPFL